MANRVELKAASFSDDVVLHRWKWASGRCERCQKLLSLENKDRESRGKWIAHSRSRRYLNSVEDCMILCWECHRATG